VNPTVTVEAVHQNYLVVCLLRIPRMTIVVQSATEIFREGVEFSSWTNPSTSSLPLDLS